MNKGTVKWFNSSKGYGFITNDEEADIVISVDASKLVGKPEKFHAPLILDGVTGRPSDRTLSIEINLIDKWNSKNIIDKILWKVK